METYFKVYGLCVNILGERIKIPSDKVGKFRGNKYIKGQEFESKYFSDFLNEISKLPGGTDLLNDYILSQSKTIIEFKEPNEEIKEENVEEDWRKQYYKFKGEE